MTKDDVTKALRQAYNLGQIYWQQADSEYMSQHKKADQTEAKFQELLETTSAALEAKDEPIGSFMTRLQAIDFLLKMRPQTEPTEKQIIATIDAYSALFGDMIESPALPQRTWVGLTDKDWKRSKHTEDFEKGVDWAEAMLKAKNT